MTTETHVYSTDGSDRKHGALRMIAMCSCGWSGTVIDGQDQLAKAAARMEWELHVQESPEGTQEGDT